MRSYREPVTKKVKQEATYLVKEVEVNGGKAVKAVKPPEDRKRVKMILNSGPSEGNTICTSEFRKECYDRIWCSELMPSFFHIVLLQQYLPVHEK